MPPVCSPKPLRRRIGLGLSWLWLSAALLCLSACREKKPEELAKMVVFSEKYREFLLQESARKWSESLGEKSRRKAIRRSEDQPGRFLFTLSERGSQSFLELKASLPARWLAQPLRHTLPPPRRLSVPVDAEDEASLRAAIELLFELFWAELSLAQGTWPPATDLLKEPESMAVRILAARWFSIKAQAPEAGLARACLDLMADAIPQSKKADLEAVEASAACLAKAASQADIPRILDLMPNGEDRVEMERVELLGALGGPLAEDHLRWVMEQARSRALQGAAKAALARSSDRPAS